MLYNGAFETSDEERPLRKYLNNISEIKDLKIDTKSSVTNTKMIESIRPINIGKALSTYSHSEITLPEAKIESEV